MKEESLEATQANVEREWIGRALKPLLEAAAPRIEQAKRMSPDVLLAVRNAQMFRMTTPRSVGGAELDLATCAQVVATIAEGDASTAWCIAQISESSMCAAYLDPSVAQEIFGDEFRVYMGIRRRAALSRRSSSGWLDRQRSLDLCEWQSDLPVACWPYTALQRGRQTVISR
jgi:hypothetical protein